MKFSTKHKSSSKPGKQRGYAAKAPLHLKGAFMNAHLSKELRKKLGRRSLRARTGDKVAIVRGQFRGKSGAIEKADTRRQALLITGIELTRRDGRKMKYPIHPSNIVITELAEDKRRMPAKGGQP